jgi:hypothetical protein
MVITIAAAAAAAAAATIIHTARPPTPPHAACPSAHLHPTPVTSPPSPYRYNAHSSAYDALEAGVPVLTCPGSHCYLQPHNKKITTIM